MQFGHNEPSGFSLTCIFCCTPIVVREQGHGDAAQRWCSEFRALYNELGEWDSPKLSGIGDRRIDDVVPIEFDRHRKEFGIDSSPHLRLMWSTPWDNPDYPEDDDPVKSAWGFFGHASCWLLFLAACPSDELYLKALNNLCRSSSDYSGMIYLGLDYGFGIPFKSNYGLGQEFGEELGIDMVRTLAETRHSRRTPIYDADPAVLRLTSKPNQWKATQILSWIAQEALGRAREDCFTFLPEEIRLLILATLPSRDVLNAKIASASLASTALGAPFWKSRFNAGQKYHCVFERPYATMRCGGWKQLFEVCKALKNDPSLCNRERIWNTLLQLRDILSGMLSRSLYGKALRSAFEKNARTGPRIKGFASARVHIPEVKNKRESQRDSCCYGSGSIESGSKALFSRLAVLPTDLLGIAATLVRHHDRTFITGVVFRSRTAGDIYIGYVDRGSLMSIDFDGNKLAGFRISACHMGLCGICAIFDTGCCSITIGIMDVLPRIQILIGETKVITLMCDFDGYKMLRLGVYETNGKGPAIYGRRSYHRDDYQWAPDIPDSSLSLSEPRVLERDRAMQRTGYLARVACMFGGERGELLDKITKVSFWFSHFCIFGIEFHHGDASMLLGTRETPGGLDGYDKEVRHVQYALDGPGGEIITSFCVEDYPGLNCLEIHTNLGRIIRVEPKHTRQANSLEYRRIDIPSSTIIVGIYADLTDCGKFGILGIISANL